MWQARGGGVGRRCSMCKLSTNCRHACRAFDSWSQRFGAGAGQQGQGGSAGRQRHSGEARKRGSEKARKRGGGEAGGSQEAGQRGSRAAGEGKSAGSRGQLGGDTMGQTAPCCLHTGLLPSCKSCGIRPFHPRFPHIPTHSSHLFPHSRLRQRRTCPSG